MPKKLYDCRTAVINSDLYVLGGKSQDYKYDNSIKRLCVKTKTWSSKTQLDPDYYLRVCSFKNNLYLIYGNRIFFVYNLRNDKWTQLANTNQNNYHAACTVFEGKIVVTGGKNKLSILKSVEAYDYHEDKWTYLPDMIEERSLQAVVSMG